MVLEEFGVRVHGYNHSFFAYGDMAYGGLEEER